MLNHERLHTAASRQLLSALQISYVMLLSQTPYIVQFTKKSMAKKTFFRWIKKRFKKQYARLHALYEIETANPTVRFDDNVQIISPDHLVLGKKVYISKNCILDCGGEKWCDYRGKITLGDHVNIAPNCVLFGAGEIEMGPRSSLGCGVMLLSQVIDLKVLEDPSLLDEFVRPHKFAKITIEEDVLIGAGTIVTQGVTIGKGSLISGNCVIKQDIPPFSCVIPRQNFKTISTKSSLIVKK